MEPKKIKKLVLNKEIISNLTENSMNNIKGGETEGTGYGMCNCNATNYCYTQLLGGCGADTSNIGGCHCA